MGLLLCYMAISAVIHSLERYTTLFLDGGAGTHASGLISAVGGLAGTALCLIGAALTGSLGVALGGTNLAGLVLGGRGTVGSLRGRGRRRSGAAAGLVFSARAGLLKDAVLKGDNAVFIQETDNEGGDSEYFKNDSNCKTECHKNSSRRTFI